jgi:hemerythrin-like domain-containing protein
MSARRRQSSSVEKVLADHEILSQYIESFNKLCATNCGTNDRQAANVVKTIINQWLVAHFAYEEQRIFPALLAARPSAKFSQRIANLQAEHKSLLQHARRLDQLLGKPNRGGSHRDVLRKSMLDFVNRLQRHSASEDEMFPSLV